MNIDGMLDTFNQECRAAPEDVRFTLERKGVDNARALDYINYKLDTLGGMLEVIVGGAETQFEESAVYALEKNARFEILRVMTEVLRPRIDPESPLYAKMESMIDDDFPELADDPQASAGPCGPAAHAPHATAGDGNGSTARMFM